MFINITVEGVTKFYIYKNDERIIDSGFNNMDDAIRYARHNNCDEVKMATWDDRKDYNNRNEADRFKVVWKRYNL